MTGITRLRATMAWAVLGAAATVSAAHAQPVEAPAARFEVEEATIASVHAAMKAGQLTCRGLVDAYLARIAAYDKNGPAVTPLSRSTRRRQGSPTISIAALPNRG